MALDKQGILNELGSVMNKLQSADCGCMGKLFSNQNGSERGATSNTGDCGFGGLSGCRGGCCHGHGCDFRHGGGEPCMGNCNPRKMYADTYNYLNTNLMQPTVNEVYNDLKSITPENTVMNNSMSGKMGLLPQGNMQGGNPMQDGNLMQEGNPMQEGNFMQGGNPMQRGNSMQGGNPMQGGNLMRGGNPMQGANAMHGGNGIQEGYPMDGGNIQGVNYMQGGNSMEGANAMYGRNDMQGGNSMQHHQMMSSPMGNQMHGNFGNESTHQRMQQMMGGMGPNIVNMMSSGGKSKPMSSTLQSGQLPGQMIIDAPQSPHGKVGVTPMNVTGAMYNAEGGILNNQQLRTPATQYVTGANMTNSGFTQYGQNAMNMEQSLANTNMQQGMTHPNMQQGMTNPNMQQGMGNLNMQHGMENPNMQQGMANTNIQQAMTNPSAGQTGNCNSIDQPMTPGNRGYGQHSLGMKKFNEMFPGVMGGDLGFDPMAIALQMNPENHKRVAMSQMNKMMSGNKEHMNSALAGANAATLNQQNGAATNQQNVPPSNQSGFYGQPGSTGTLVAQNQQIAGDTNLADSSYHPNQQQVYYQTNQAPQQPIYTRAPATNQEQVPLQQQYQYQQQQMVNPNTGAPLQQTTPAVNQGAVENVNAQQQGKEYTSEAPPEQQIMIQDPIFPADTSSRPFNLPLNMRRQKMYQYNTLGQSVQLLPAKMFHSSPETNLPQTLYPQPPSGKLRKDLSGHNVKSTVSKTSLMGNKPVGKTPSRSQLQNVYHQFKGSHSNTQQNVRNAAYQGSTNSEGKIGVQGVVAQARPVPVERFGGDTSMNNQPMHNLTPVKEQPIEQHGDVATGSKPHGDTISTKEPPKMEGNVGNIRNGLQDMVYTAYPTSAAWSFHGEGMQYARYRTYRNRG